MMQSRTLIVLLLLTAAGTASAGVKPYKGAEYRTTQSFLYGRFETRMKANGREGMLASFFTYNDNYPATPWNEIDIEILGRYTDDVQFNTITPGTVNHVSHQYVSYDPALEYHVYGFEWTPAYVAWFIDSVEVCRQTGAHIATLQYAQKIMMNVWPPSAEGWAGKWNDAVLPAYAFYDWVSYASYTPGSGTIGTGSNFTPQWRDEMTSWDQGRWEKATHTWDGNGCDFVPENAVFANGQLALCLTKAGALGAADLVPPAILWARTEKNAVRLFFSEPIAAAVAETPANYFVQNCTVASARLLPDQRTVVLAAVGADTAAVGTVAAMNIIDRAPTANAMTLKAVKPIRGTPVTFPVRINAGGGVWGAYGADQVWSESVEYGHLDGSASSFGNVTIANTTEAEVYRTELAGFCEYKIRVPDGRYMVTLMFAENYFLAAGQRINRVVVEGVTAESALDLFSKVGYRTAYQRTVFANVSDGVLDIHAQATIDQPLLNGIVVQYLGTEVREGSLLEHLPRRATVVSNFPNPFNGGTMLQVDLAEPESIRFRVYDALGRLVDQQDLGTMPKGITSWRWVPHTAAGGTLPTGPYYAVLNGSGQTIVHRMLYLK